MQQGRFASGSVRPRGISAGGGCVARGSPSWTLRKQVPHASSSWRRCLQRVEEQRWCWMRTHAACLAGLWTAHWRAIWLWWPYAWRCLPLANGQPGAHLRPWHSICGEGPHPTAEGAPQRHQHEPERQSLRQRDLRVVPENAQVRGSLSAGVMDFGRGSRLNRGLYRECLQRKAFAFSIGLPPAVGV
jgi:hypothetical protein